MRIALFAERFPPAGGGISTAHYQLSQLLLNDHQIKLFAFVNEDLPSDGSTVRGKGNPWLKWIARRILSLAVRRVEPKAQIDACRKIADAYASILSINRELGRFHPDVVVVSDDRLPLLALRRPKKSKIVWVAHHNYFRFIDHPYFSIPSRQDYFVAHRLERRSIAKADYAVFPSEYMQSVFRATLSCDLPGEVIPNFFSSTASLKEQSRARAELKLPTDGAGIFIPSGGTFIKGARFVPEIVRRIRERADKTFFVITGPIDEYVRRELENARGSSSIYMPGPVTHEINLQYVQACDLAVSPTLIENYSCALLECQSFGLPIVTFDVGGNREIVRDGESGFVVPAYDIDDLCDSARKIVADEQLRLTMARAAQVRSSQVSDASGIRTAWNNLLTRLVTA